MVRRRILACAAVAIALFAPARSASASAAPADSGERLVGRVLSPSFDEATVLPPRATGEAYRETVRHAPADVPAAALTVSLRRSHVRVDDARGTRAEGCRHCRDATRAPPLTSV